MRLDTHELRKLSADLGRASNEVLGKAQKVVKKGAQNIKETMVEEAKGAGAQFSSVFPSSISYDPSSDGGLLAYEIGPDKQRAQGALGNLLYFGSSKNGPVLDVEAGLRKETPNFEKHMGDLGLDLLK